MRRGKLGVMHKKKGHKGTVLKVFQEAFGQN